MRKILLDFQITKTQAQVQDYLALELDFPEHYGRNLDALYDMLTEMTEDTCIGVFESQEESRDSEPGSYLRRVKKVMRDAEQENPHLCIVFARQEDNYE